ncbi:MAG: DUF4351 domain-containing protein [Chroococcidiopsidaceae cyanobacterium CP_BM_ER_R8_30]|nr:DUF4351 domain-containing protein [Chroococcidiopsidaceae cyanobacterium CP_BM_ER_R8_30]
MGQVPLEVRSRSVGFAQSQIQQLRVTQLEELAEALLDFASVQDFTDWLQAHQS